MSKLPFGVVSDQHNHNFSAFSSTLPSGVNSRLQITIDELFRMADEVKARGGKRIYNAGDVFHVRGSIAPSVLNPVQDAYKKLVDDGFEVFILAGNHDLESKESARVSSAITSLEKVGCKIINEPMIDLAEGVAMIPWIQSIKALKEAIEAIDPADRPNLDLFIHAPLDGTIIGLPDHGLDPAWLQTLGFRRVFSGHYHHHKDFGGGVYSIGASTHQTWGDVGSKAGYLIVDGPKVEYRASHAPEFVEIDSEVDPAEIPLIADGNYVRAKINSNKSSDIEALRGYLLDNGAKGVTIVPTKTVAAPSERKAAIAAGASMEGSIGNFIMAGEFAKKGELILLCNDILSTVRSAA